MDGRDAGFDLHGVFGKEEVDQQENGGGENETDIGGVELNVADHGVELGDQEQTDKNMDQTAESPQRVGCDQGNPHKHGYISNECQGQRKKKHGARGVPDVFRQR